jgi:hypothetical protein
LHAVKFFITDEAFLASLLIRAGDGATVTTEKFASVGSEAAKRLIATL